MTSDEIRLALKAFMAKRGMNPSAWSLAATGNRSTLRMFLDGAAKTITMEFLEKLAIAAGVTVFDIIGTGPRKPSGMVQVPWLSVRAELDGRIVTGTDKTKQPLLMPRAWLERHAFGEHGRLFLWQMKTGYDDGHAGDLVAIDIRVNNPRRVPGTYAIWTDGAVMVRKIQPLAGTALRMMAEGAPFDTTSDQIQVIGRALWRSGDI